jgi:excisionase family DNA binding protein
MTSEQPQEQPTIDPLLVRVDEAARLLSLSRSTIYEMMDAGELPSVRRGAARRIPVAALHAWIANQIDTSTTS